MKKVWFLFTISMLILVVHQAQAELTPREILNRANEFIFSAEYIKRIDVSEANNTIYAGEKKIEQPKQISSMTIEIEHDKLLAKQTVDLNGQLLIMIKHDKKAVMKIGTGTWQVPTGPYERMAQDMGNLFVCEEVAPETDKNAPNWILVKMEKIDGLESVLVESKDNSAVALAQERMTKGIEINFKDNPAQKPTVEVIEYKSKNWLGKSDFRRIKVIQTSKVTFLMPSPDGSIMKIEKTGTTTSSYDYSKNKITVPAEAETLLLSK